MINKHLQSSEPYYSSQSELELWDEMSKGSETAYEKLYNSYVNELYRYGYMVIRDRSIVEDAIQDVFTDLWKSRHSLGKITSIRLYLFSSVKRRLLRKLKKERIFYHPEDNMAFPLESEPSFLDIDIDETTKKSLAKKVRDSLQELSARQREIIYLRFYQDMNYAEIAELLELDQKYVYNLASKAFCNLRAQISNFILLLAVFFIQIFF